MWNNRESNFELFNRYFFGTGVWKKLHSLKHKVKPKADAESCPIRLSRPSAGIQVCVKIFRKLLQTVTLACPHTHLGTWDLFFFLFFWGWGGTAVLSHTYTGTHMHTLETVHVRTDKCYQCLKLKPTPANFTQIKPPLFSLANPFD